MKTQEKKRKIYAKGTKKELLLSNALEDFLLDCQSRNLSKSTLRNYSTANRFLIDFLGDVDIYSVTETDVKTYVISCIKRNVSSCTLRTYIKSIKILFRYYNIELNISLPKAEEKVKEIFTPDELQRLLTKPTKKTFTHLRDYTIVCALLGTGVRANTLVNLKWKHIDFINNTIFLEITKTHKQYYIPLSHALKVVLKEWRAITPLDADENYVFTTHWGDKMACDTLKAMIQNYHKARNVSGRGTHKYRRTYATTFIRNDGNLLYLQQMLGHSKLDTTKKYCTIDVNDIKVQYSNKNALDMNLKRKIKSKK